MSTTYVAVDVETTGLDPYRNEIIEIGVVRFADGEIVESFDSLIRSEADIPSEITRLTGIDDTMVADAPTIFQLRPQLRQLVNNAVIVGHNVSFDMGFLEMSNVGVGQHRVDTLTLATILAPEVGRFSLDALAHHLALPGYGGDQTHRALDDARLTVELFHVLCQRADALNFDMLEEIVQAGKRIGWPETVFFEDLYREKGRTAFGQRSGRRRQLFDPEITNDPPPVPREELGALDVDMLQQMLEPDGNFGRLFPNYEYRPEQVDMLTAVADALNQGQHLLVEAGTGTGKSIGYLLPAAFWSVQNGRRVVVSTNTINLQDQLLHKDIPELQRILPFDLRATVLKGKRNYLCTRLFKQMRHGGPKDADEMALFARILAWLPQTDTGDMAEITLRGTGERMIWNRLNAENDVCNRETCASERCPLAVARRRAEQAHVVVVNHALLLADIGRGFLPEYKDVIIDEAHHLESAVTDGLSFRADRRFLASLLDEMRGRSGLIGDVEGQTRILPPEFRDVLDGYLNAVRNAAGDTTEIVEQFFDTLAYFAQDQVNRSSQYSQAVRLLPATRKQPQWDEVEVIWEGLNGSLKRIAEGLLRIADGVAELSESFDIEDAEELALAVANAERDLTEVRENIHAIITAPGEEMIYWIELFRDRLSIHAAPLHVGPLVEEHLFHEMETVVMASATMRTANPYRNGESTFDYIRDRLYARDALELAVGSPFDYPNHTLLYLMTDIPEPNRPGYQRYVEEAIVDVATALGGRTLVLFTSYGQLNATARAVEGPLADAGIMTLAQGDGISRQQLLAQFKTPGARAVLLGTRSFWEGVDVPGEALQAVLIAKIPFDVPSDPIFAARSETFENSFFEYSIPEAVLRFRQGFGRLIRRTTDEGVVAILDRRVLSKRYGQLFVDALPECMVLRQRSHRLGELTRRWLDREK